MEIPITAVQNIEIAVSGLLAVVNNLEGAVVAARGKIAAGESNAITETHLLAVLLRNFQSLKSLSFGDNEEKLAGDLVDKIECSSLEDVVSGLDTAVQNARMGLETGGSPALLRDDLLSHVVAGASFLSKGAFNPKKQDEVMGL